MNYPAKTPTQLGQLLKAFRLERRMTQAEVAARMGLDQAKISALEANPARTSVERIFRLLSVLGVDVVLSDREAAAPRARRKTQW